MRVALLKKELLNWLYGQYQLQPDKPVNIAPMVMESGINTVDGVLDYGRTLVNAGLITEGNHKGREVFLATITIKGIDYVSPDIEKETQQLLKGIQADAVHFYPVTRHLEYLPKHHKAAIDFCQYLHANDWADIKITDDDVFIRITERGLALIGDDRRSRGLYVA
ncbi:MAG: hypothetical protein SFW35_07240 [Chitinophagales bacterium]|nr:hypothetical protein [Chitinophagales bacterium]